MENNFEQPMSQSTPIQQPVNEIPESKSKFKLILLIVILLVFVGGVAFYFGTKQNTLLLQNQQKPTPIITQSAPTLALDPTASWGTYANTKYGFSIKYPTDTRVLKEQNQQVMGVLNPASVIASVSLISSDFRLSSTGVSIAVDTSKNCNLDQNGQKITKTKDFNGNTFLIAGENIEDDASGGERHSYNIYNLARNNICYEIQSSVGYTDVTFAATQPSVQEIQKQQDWIQTQKQLNDQILSTFKFTPPAGGQNQATDLTPDQIFQEVSSQLGFTRNQIGYFRIFGQNRVQYGGCPDSTDCIAGYAYKVKGKWFIAQNGLQSMARCSDLQNVPEQYRPPCGDQTTGTERYLASDRTSLNYPPSQSVSYIGQ